VVVRLQLLPPPFKNCNNSSTTSPCSDQLTGQRWPEGLGSTFLHSGNPTSHLPTATTTSTFSSMEVHPLLGQLDSLLSNEAPVRGSVSPSASSSGISPGMRDGSAHVLRCLKVWYDLPSDCFHTAVANIDIFMAKMKAQPKHLSCIAVSSFHLACKQYQQVHGDTVSVPEPTDLVTISQSRCSASDLLRMEAILVSKLDSKKQAVPPLPVTPLSFLRIMMAVSRAAATKLEICPAPEAVPLPHLIHQLEILVCDSSTQKFRPCELALAVLCTEFQQLCAQSPDNTTALMGFITELQKYCNISSEDFMLVLREVVAILEKYNQAGQVPHRQRLVWKLSNRTLRHLRPTDRLRPTLPKICEEAYTRKLDDNRGSGLGGSLFRMRSASESSLESEPGDLSGSDTECSGGVSETESSDVEMEEPRTWARIVAAS